MGVNSLPKTVTRQRRYCDLNQGPSVPESSTLTTRLPSHPSMQLATDNRYAAPTAVDRYLLPASDKCPSTGQTDRRTDGHPTVT